MHKFVMEIWNKVGKIEVGGKTKIIKVKSEVKKKVETFSFEFWIKAYFLENKMNREKKTATTKEVSFKIKYFVILG